MISRLYKLLDDLYGVFITCIGALLLTYNLISFKFMELLIIVTICITSIFVKYVQGHLNSQNVKYFITLPFYSSMITFYIWYYLGYELPFEINKVEGYIGFSTISFALFIAIVAIYQKYKSWLIKVCVFGVFVYLAFLPKYDLFEYLQTLSNNNPWVFHILLGSPLLYIAYKLFLDNNVNSAQS